MVLRVFGVIGVLEVIGIIREHAFLSPVPFSGFMHCLETLELRLSLKLFRNKLLPCGYLTGCAAPLSFIFAPEWAAIVL